MMKRLVEEIAKQRLRLPQKYRDAVSDIDSLKHHDTEYRLASKEGSCLVEYYDKEWAFRMLDDITLVKFESYIKEY